MATKVVELQPETPTAKYLRWTRIGISLLSFGMVFPNALTERMEVSEPAGLIDTTDKKRS